MDQKRQRTKHAFLEKVPPGSAARCGRARARRPDGLGLPQRAAGGEQGLEPPPASASAAAGSGCDKLNLRALEKLQEEESEECAEWL